MSESRGGDSAELMGHVDAVRRMRVGAVPDLLGCVDATRRTRAGAMPDLLGRMSAVRRIRSGRVFELLGQVGAARRSKQGQHERLLRALAPELKAAKAKERELDRRFASRFNVFKYLRTDELGLSRLIADLLDPSAEHGQGSVFLNAMLDVLRETGEKTRALFGKLRATVATPATVVLERRIPVVTERGIPSAGFIDITVDIQSDDGTFCLAFENKPYADDGYRQLVKYLEYLDGSYKTRFLLVYLPPYDREPDEIALSPEDREYWRDRGQFRVMPYSGGEISLEAWFGACRKRCRAERLRPYLEDAQSFCRHQFGGLTMTTDSETHAIRTHLFANVDQMHAALAVHDAWPAVRTEVCERFLRQLHRKVEEELEKEFPGVSDFHVQRRFNKGDNQFANQLCIFRDGWMTYDCPPTVTRGRSAVVLQGSKKGLNGWYWGVRVPKARSTMTEGEKECRIALEAMLIRRNLSLSGGDDDWWPQWEYVDEPYRNWHPLAPDLAEECEAGGGTITDYFVEGLLRIARMAIPAIDDVEGVDTVAAASQPVLDQDPEQADDPESPHPANSRE